MTKRERDRMWKGRYVEWQSDLEHASTLARFYALNTQDHEEARICAVLAAHYAHRIANE